MSTEARILVVDDEPGITDLIATVLRYEGFEVAIADSVEQGLRTARRVRPDLVLLDVMLPDGEGFSMLPKLRESRDVPVLFLTARDSVEDRVRGLTIGGDDYITKPFSLEELTARVRIALRRSGVAARRPLAVADLELDEAAREARRDGVALALTPTEYMLLHCLLEHAGHVLSKQQLLDRVWHYDFGGNANIVETYIKLLRRKVDAGRTPLIHTVRGFGYVIREQPPA